MWPNADEAGHHSMRIVAVADTHSFEEDVVVPDGDVFIHAGDLMRLGGLEELVPVARWLHQLPHAQKIVVAGNHDWCFAESRERAVRLLGPDVHYLQDSGVVLDGIRFWGSPWQPEFHSWAFNVPRGERLREIWSRIPDETDVLVTHGPPYGLGDRVHRRRVGCRELLAARARVRPTLHLFGHIHEDGGVFEDAHGLLANVTTVEGTRGATVLEVVRDERGLTARGLDVPSS